MVGRQACQEGREGTHSPTVLLGLAHLTHVLSPFIAIWIK